MHNYLMPQLKRQKLSVKKTLSKLNEALKFEVFTVKFKEWFFV